MLPGEIEEGAAATSQPPRALIVTIFGLYVRETGGWISVGALIRMLAIVGVDDQAVRSSVSRLKRRGILESERRDGAAGYVLSDYARGILDVGDRRIFQRPRDADESWVIAVFSVPESERHKRHVLRGRLSWLGFGTVSAGVWIAPAHVTDDARDVLRREKLDSYADLFAAQYLAFGDPAEQVARWWDLDGLEHLYQEFLAGYGPVLGRWQTSPGTADEALADYVRALTAWRRLPYLDPGLPARLLPATWSGSAAAEVFFGIKTLLEQDAHDAATRTRSSD